MLSAQLFVINVVVAFIVCAHNIAQNNEINTRVCVRECVVCVREIVCV